MSEVFKETPFLMNLGFLITYKCQVACPHCIVEAGPHRTEYMKFEDFSKWIDQAAAYVGRKIEVATFTGGEPFFDMDLFGSMIAYAVSKGIVPTAVTNAFWARTYESAITVLQSFPALRFLSISADEHHQKCIPFENVENAVRASQKLGVVCTVAVSTENVDSPAYKNLKKRLGLFIDEANISTNITSHVGRARSCVSAEAYQTASDIPRGACFDANTPVVFPDGTVRACIGPIIDIHRDNPLILGNLNQNTLEEILDNAEVNPILHIIRLWGPAKLFELLTENGFTCPMPKRLIEHDMCAFCHHLMNDPATVSAMKALGDMPEIREITAYARKYYMDDETMLQLLEIGV